MNKKADRYHWQLLKNKGIMEYLAGRGFNRETVIKANIGLTFGYSYEKKKEGLKPSEHPFFYNRIMFPFVRDGKVIGFTARDITTISDYCLNEFQINFKESMKAKNQEISKYKNSMESDIFKKSEFLYGQDDVRHEVCIVVESPLNKIAVDILLKKWVSFMGAGIYADTSVVATNGTSLSKYQINLLKERGVKTLLIINDGDRAGYSSTFKNCVDYGRDFHHIMAVIMPKNKDVADYINSPTIFQGTIDKGLCDMTEYIERYLNKEYGLNYNAQIAKYKELGLVELLNFVGNNGKGLGYLVSDNKTPLNAQMRIDLGLVEEVEED